MSYVTHQYVVRNACQVEARKETGRGFGAAPEPPKGWLEVRKSSDHDRLWDLCPKCSEDLRRWIAERVLAATRRAEPEPGPFIGPDGGRTRELTGDSW